MKRDSNDNPAGSAIVRVDRDGQTGATPQYAGLIPGLLGLYRINVAVPTASPRGNAVPANINQNNAVSNRVDVAIQ